MAKVLRITNLVNQHKKMAEGFLSQMQEAGSIPKMFSGVATPKFGNYVFVWQFNKNKLVGSNAIHVNNISNLRAKLAASASGMDFLAPKIEINEDADESGE